MDLNQSITTLARVGSIMKNRLSKLNITTIFDLLWHLPTRYENYSVISTVSQAQAGETVTLIGRIISGRNIYSNRKSLQKFQLEDATGVINITWFNQPYLVRIFVPGIKLAVAGKISKSGRNIELISPEFEIVKQPSNLISTGRLVPIYSETYGISSKWLRQKIWSVVEKFKFEEYLPEVILTKNKLLNISDAFRLVHLPPNLEIARVAKYRLAFEELFLLQLKALTLKTIWQSRLTTSTFTINYQKIDDLISTLPYALTQAQKRSLNEILSDLQKNTSMNRLLEGDVGSGKTVVAAISMYVCHLNGFRSILMAPTEILAAQHYSTLKSILSSYNIKIGLLTRSSNRKISTNLDSLDIVIGTHALFQNKVKLSRVRLVVIDEQHRFGVEQRSLLRLKGDIPHVLTMTATPIPRSLALTLYGNLDLSIIDQMPKNRHVIKTWVVPHYKRLAAYKWIKQQILNSKFQQAAFIVCPFINTSENLKSVKAAVQEYGILKTQIFPELSIGLLHGKLSGQEKEKVLSRFLKKEIHILVCTPIVEVGIDIPHATMMVIEGSERFGLAALHQLRGRVGRSHIQSYCLLFSSTDSQASISRLKYLQSNHIGIKLAEIDLKLRGQGNIYGLTQHGLSELKAADINNLDLIYKTRTEAYNLLKSDPKLEKEPLLKQRAFPGKIEYIVPD